MISSDAICKHCHRAFRWSALTAFVCGDCLATAGEQRGERSAAPPATDNRQGPIPDLVAV